MRSSWRAAAHLFVAACSGDELPILTAVAGFGLHTRAEPAWCFCFGMIFAFSSTGELVSVQEVKIMRERGEKTPDCHSPYRKYIKSKRRKIS